MSHGRGNDLNSIRPGSIIAVRISHTLPPTIKLRAAAGVAHARQILGEQVIARFSNYLRDARLLVFLDDNDRLRGNLNSGEAVRGLHTSVRDDPAWIYWPDYVVNHVFDQDLHPLVDDFVYLFGSTCQGEIDLAMTLAHELRHCVQRREYKTFWAANMVALRLINSLAEEERIDLAINSSSDVPHERDACIFAKQVAEGIFGAAQVSEHIQSKIVARKTKDDAANWISIQAMATTSRFSLAHETVRFLQRLKQYKAALVNYLPEYAQDPDFDGLDLDQLLNSPPDVSYGGDSIPNVDDSWEADIRKPAQIRVLPWQPP